MNALRGKAESLKKRYAVLSKDCGKNSSEPTVAVTPGTGPAGGGGGQLEEAEAAEHSTSEHSTRRGWSLFWSRTRPKAVYEAGRDRTVFPFVTTPGSRAEIIYRRLLTVEFVTVIYW